MIKLILLITLITKIYAGDGVGNGGGIAESNLTFAFYNIDSFFRYAKDHPSITFSNKELELLDKISESLSSEYRDQNSLIFLSGKKNPRTFILPFPEVRIAVTGSKVGSPIKINTDLLYNTTENGVIALSIPQAVSIITHELGHHHGIEDEQFLNMLGARVAKSIYGKVETRTLRDAKNIYLKYINLSGKNISQIIVGDSENAFNFNRDLAKKARCPVSEGNQFRLAGAEVWQANWSRFGRANWYLKLELILYCSNGKEVKEVTGLEYYLVPSFVKKNQKVRITEIHSYIKQCDPRTTYCLAKQEEAQRFIQTQKHFQEEK